jgi:hypothetical protein
MWAKQSTALTLIVGPILDSTGAEYASAVIGDLSISKNGGTLTALASTATLTYIANGYYTLALNTTNTNTLGVLQITCNKSTYQMPPFERMILPATVYDALTTNETNVSGGLLAATATITATGAYIGNATAALAVDASGRVDVSKIGGTTQTARDIGASVLLSSGTGTGQISLSSGRVTANADQLGGAAVTATTSVTFPAACTVATTTGAVGSVTGAVGSVTGLTASDVAAIKAKTDNLPADTATELTDIANTVAGVSASVWLDPSRTLTSLPAAPTDWLTAAAVKADAVTKIQSGLATPTNITAGTITTVTNLTNAPTSGDFTATMKTSIGTAVAASAVASVTGNVGGDVTGSVGSVVGAVGSVTGAVGSVTGAVGSVTGNVGGNVVGSVGSVTSRVTANTDQLAGQTVTAAAGVTFPAAVGTSTLTQSEVTGGAYALDSASFAYNAALPLTTQQKADVTAAVPTSAAVTTAVWAAGSRTLTSLSGLTVDTVTTLTNLPSIPANWLTAAGTAADFTTEIQSGLATAASIAALNNLSAAQVNAEVDAALADVGLTTTVTGRIDVASSTLATAANLATLTGYVDTEVGAIKAVTDKLDTALELDGAVYRYTTNALELAPSGGGDGSTLTAIPWNAAWDAEVQSEVADALTAYGASTYAGADTAGTTTLLSRVTAAVALAGSAPSWYSAPVDVSANVTAIKAKTDNLPAAPAAVGDIPTASQIATAWGVRDLGYGVTADEYLQGWIPKVVFSANGESATVYCADNTTELQTLTATRLQTTVGGLRTTTPTI